MRDIIGDNAFFVAESGAFPRSFSGNTTDKIIQLTLQTPPLLRSRTVSSVPIR